MKKTSILGICVVVLLAGAFLFAMFMPIPGLNFKTQARESPQSSSLEHPGEILGGQVAYKIVLNATPVSAPGTVMVYKTEKPTVTRATAIEFAKKFNVTDIDDDIREGYTKISLASRDNRYHMQLFKNGGQTYTDSQRYSSPNGIDTPENLPTDDHAKVIATAFLKERGLLPEDAIVNGSEHHRVFTSTGGVRTVSWESIIVYYGRELNGLRVKGTQFTVEVAAHGDIIDYFANWKPYKPIGEYPVKTCQEATRELQKKSVNVGTLKPDTVSIDEVYLAYYTDALAYPESYLEPVWVFKGNAMLNGTQIQPVEEYIPALKEVPKKLISQ